MSYKKRRRNKKGLSPKTKKSIRLSFAVVIVLLLAIGAKKITEPRFEPTSVQLKSIDDLEKIHKGVIRKVSKEHEFETKFKRFEENDDFMDLIEERNYKFDLDGNASLSSSIYRLEDDTVKTSSYFYKDKVMKYASGTNGLDEVSTPVTGNVTDPKIIEPFINGHRINQEIDAWDRFINGILKEKNLKQSQFIVKKGSNAKDDQEESENKESNSFNILGFEKFAPSSKVLKEMYPEVKEFDWMQIIQKEGSPEITIVLHYVNKDGVNVKDERTFVWDLDGEKITFPSHSISEDVEASEGGDKDVTE